MQLSIVGTVDPYKNSFNIAAILLLSALVVFWLAIYIQKYRNKPRLLLHHHLGVWTLKNSWKRTLAQGEIYLSKVVYNADKLKLVTQHLQTSSKAGELAWEVKKWVPKVGDKHHIPSIPAHGSLVINEILLHGHHSLITDKEISNWILEAISSIEILISGKNYKEVLSFRR